MTNRSAAAAMREEAAKLIRETQIVHSNVAGTYLSPRAKGSTEGLAWADAIDALPLPADEPAPGDHPGVIASTREVIADLQKGGS